VNTVDPAFFEKNIKAGYQQRKERHFDKDEQPLKMVPYIYELIKNSNQIVHNKGKALSYLSNKRKEGPAIRNPPHQYGLAARPRQWEQARREPPAALGSRFSEDN
jgi:hypothetical protein